MVRKVNPIKPRFRPGEKGIFVIASLLLLVAAKLGPSLEREIGDISDLPLDIQTSMQNTALNAVFGEFRGGLADMLWLKTEDYLHGGVSYRSLTEKEKNQ